MEISFERTWIDRYFCIPIFDFWFQIINEKIFRVLKRIFYIYTKSVFIFRNDQEY